MPKEILLVEDHVGTSIALKSYLIKAGYTVYHRDDGEEALKFILDRAYKLDLIVLDVMLPNKNGLDILKEVRMHDLTIPVLLLTTLKDTVNIVKGLDLGADDYLTKPFAAAELQARLKSLLRRAEGGDSDKLIKGKFKLDPSEKTCYYMEEQLNLTAKEYDLLQFFLTHANRPLSRDYILLNVWNMDNLPGPTSIDVHVRRLRKKLQDEAAELIRTIHGIGYKFQIS